MDIFDSSGRRIRLTDQNFVAEGGEGRLYTHGGYVYKVYLEPAKVIPAEKIAELARLDHPSIIRPLGPIFDGNRGEQIGYSMMKVSEGAVALPRLFTSAFWNANGITPEKIATLVEAMQKTIAFVHKQGFLQVDGNEFNYMVGSGFVKPYFIDVDSYQTPNYPATAIMPSIRDYTRTGFSAETDWFSFAIVVFQLFAGIHPFKGRHPDFRKNDFEGRIKAGVSVLDKAVSYPSSVRDFGMIPKAYMGWFEALFVRGERGAPPSGDIRVAVQRRKRVIQDGLRVAIREIASFDGAVRRFRTLNGQQVVRVGERIFVGKRAYDIPDGTSAVVLGDQGAPLFVVTQDGRVAIIDGENGARTESTLEAQRVFVAGNVPYLINGEDLVEMKILQIGGRLVVGPGPTRKILPNATSVYNGLVVESVLGKTHLLIPAAPGVMPIVAVPELDAYRIVEAKYERGVAGLLVATKDGQYRQARVRFDAAFTRYDFELRDDADDLNFTVLDKGIIVSIPRDGVIEVAPSTPGGGAVRVVEDPQIRLFMRLVNDAGRLAFYAEHRIYAATLK